MTPGTEFNILGSTELPGDPINLDEVQESWIQNLGEQSSSWRAVTSVMEDDSGSLALKSGSANLKGTRESLKSTKAGPEIENILPNEANVNKNQSQLGSLATSVNITMEMKEINERLENGLEILCSRILHVEEQHVEMRKELEEITKAQSTMMEQLQGINEARDNWEKEFAQAFERVTKNLTQWAEDNKQRICKLRQRLEQEDEKMFDKLGRTTKGIEQMQKKHEDLTHRLEELEIDSWERSYQEHARRMRDQGVKVIAPVITQAPTSMTRKTELREQEKAKHKEETCLDYEDIEGISMTTYESPEKERHLDPEDDKPVTRSRERNRRGRKNSSDEEKERKDSKEETPPSERERRRNQNRPAGKAIVEFFPFSGEESDNAVMWAAEMRSHIRRHELENADARQLLFRNLKGAAYEYLRARDMSELRNANSMIELILERWNVRDGMGEAKARFMRRKQKREEDFRTFMDHLTQLRRKGWPRETNDAQREEIFKQFVLGLVDRDLSQYVNNYVAMNYDYDEMPSARELVEICAKRMRVSCGTSQQMGGYSGRSYHEDRSNWANRSNDRNGRESVERSNQRNESQDRSRDNQNSPGACYGCGSLDHLIRDCRQYRVRVVRENKDIPIEEVMKINQPDTQGFWKQQVKQKPPCFKCGKLGHWKNECPLNV